MADPGGEAVAEPPSGAGFAGSVRGRLLVIALLPILVLTPILIGITMQRWLMRTDQILAARVTSDLTVGRQYLDHLIANTRQQVLAHAASAAFHEALATGRPLPLEPARAAMSLDFLMVEQGDSPAESGLVVLSSADLARIDPDLARRAQIQLVPEGVETRGLVILAAVPFTLPDGGQARLRGGILLNGNEGFIDRISDLVYPASNPALADQAPDQGLDHGVITLFLDNMRISTTLRPFGTGRALGTRASQAVTAQVLGEGRSWHDTAFVVNAWYISAYEPLLDLSGNRIGMLYAGIPMAPYTAARRVTFVMIGLAFLVVAGGFVPLALGWARGIFRPVEAMGRTIARVDEGDLSARSGAQAGAEEITRLSHHLDRLLAGLEQREAALKGLNADLNARVEETSRQLVLAEKLATIGEVTAGIAHEINNPLAVISGNLEVVRMELEAHGAEAGTELALIDGQIRRINALVTRLLQFARPEEFTDPEGTAATMAGSDAASAIAGIRPLVAHLLAQKHLILNEDLRSHQRLRMNRHELEQVLVNLVANAAHALQDGGRIVIAAEDQPGSDGRPGLSISITDNGPGMDAATMARIFDPFFTTRGGEGGTGLGLSICQTLVARQGGHLWVTSQPGQGARFSLWLPALAAESDSL